MNNIDVTVELCAEDRARFDKIIGLLEARASQAQLILEHEYDKPSDDLNEMLKKAISPDPVEVPKNAQDAPKEADHPTLEPFPERPEAVKEPSETTEKPVSTAELQQLVIALCRAGKKDKVREVVSAYGVQTVAAIPEDKRTEAYATLKKLEG